MVFSTFFFSLKYVHFLAQNRREHCRNAPVSIPRKFFRAQVAVQGLVQKDLDL